MHGLLAGSTNPPPPPPSAAALLDTNQRFYDALWSDSRLIEADRFNTWPLMQELAAQAPRRLEVAPGLRLRLPIAGTQFVDRSPPAVTTLAQRRAAVARGCITALPFGSAAFDLVCALDIIEHVDDDERALAELARVTAAGGVLVLSTPLHAARWTAFDAFVGHRRRYEPEPLLAQLARHRLRVERSAAFGMQPRSSLPLEWSMYYLTRHPARAMWLYNRVIMPIALRLQDPLHLHAGMIPTAQVDEVLLVCRKDEPVSW
ncbi:MAG: methyltransferase domain-containing protein [bacterium]